MQFYSFQYLDAVFSKWCLYVKVRSNVMPKYMIDRVLFGGHKSRKCNLLQVCCSVVRAKQ